jgi:hypothetical protein
LLESDRGVVGDGSVAHVDDLGERVAAGQRHGAVEMGNEVFGEGPQDAGDDCLELDAEIAAVLVGYEA